MVYQTVWVVSVTFVIWFTLIARYSATTAFGLYISHAIVRRGRRTSGAERTSDARHLPQQ